MVVQQFGRPGLQTVIDCGGKNPLVGAGNAFERFMIFIFELVG
jgi:hypothetical protein